MKTEENPQRNGTGLPGGTEKLLRSYFDAFANLYGITPLYRAFRIIQKQNPELKLTEEDFLQFVDQLDQEERLYTIAGAEDIYDDVKEPTPPMKREIVAEYLYALDGFESYLELKEEQADKPYYIPEKDAYYPKGHIPKPAESQHLRENNRRPAPGPLFFHTCKRPTADRSKNPMARRPSKRRQFPRVPASPIPPA